MPLLDLVRPDARRPTQPARPISEESTTPQIVVVGGGAGGLELVTRLAETVGKRGDADIVLVDHALTHLWKPLLHEAAAGTLATYADHLEYLAHAYRHHFRFRLGHMDGLDRKAREVYLAPAYNELGEPVAPRRTLPYDYLIIAVGSVSNDFGIPGVQEYCYLLDRREDAEAFNHRWVDDFLRAQTQATPLRAGQLTVAIVGGGATGVELAAELHDAAAQFVRYGFDLIDPARDVKLAVVQSKERLLPELPPRIGDAVAAQLRELGVEVYTGEMVVEVTPDGVLTRSGRFIPAAIKVWTAGIKAPDFLRDLDGLEANRMNQLIVRDTLQTTHDDRIFAFGDCAAAPLPGRTHPVPPRAQAAHQEAELLAKSLRRVLQGRAPLHYRYHDRGSLISLGRASTIGSLIGRLTGSFMIEGRIARLLYIGLYKLHQIALHGYAHVTLTSLANWLTRKTRPRLKLH